MAVKQCGAYIVLICMMMYAACALENELIEGAPEDGVFEGILAEIGHDPELILRPIRETPFFCRRKPRGHNTNFTSVDLPTTTSDSCTGCTVVLSVLGTLVKVFRCGYEDLKPILMIVCRDVVTGRGYDADLICETTLDNYGNPVVEIVKKNKKSAKDSCYFLNVCISDDIINGVPDYPATWRTKPNDTPEDYIQRKNNVVVDRWRDRARVMMNEDKRPKRDVENTQGILRVVQFTDIHVDEEYAVGSATDCGLPLCCREEYKGTGSAGFHGEWLCNVPPSTTLKFMEKMATLNPDIILYTGDSPPHHLWQETMESMYNVTLLVADMLNEAFPSIPIYSTIGNHELFPTNLYYPGGREETSIFHDVFIDAYKDVGELGTDQEDTIRHGGYYSTLIRPGLRLLAYNSNYGSTNNWYNLLNYDEEIYSDMKTFMSDTLEMAQSNNEDVLLITHHPQGSGILDFDKDIKSILLKYSDIIKLNIAGHIHKESWRMFHDPTDGAAKLVQIMSQSANTYKTVNPGARIYFFDDATMELLDYHQYYLDVGGNNDADAPVILAYKMTEEYKMDSLSPSAWQDLTNRMITDDDLFNKYWFNRQTRNGENGECTGECRRQAICKVDSAALDEYYACLNRDDDDNDDDRDDDDNDDDRDDDNDDGNNDDNDDGNDDNNNDDNNRGGTGSAPASAKPVSLWTVFAYLLCLIFSRRN